MELTTRASHSPRQDGISRLVRIERMGGLAYVSENVVWSDGSKLSLRLKPDIQEVHAQFLEEVSRYLKDIVVRPRVDVRIEIGEAPFSARSQTWLTLQNDAVKRCEAVGREIIPISLGDTSSHISGVVFLFLRKLGNKLSMFDESHNRIKAFTTTFTPDLVFEQYQGNRVTVNGFKMSLKKQKSLHSHGRKTLPLVFDIEIEAADNVVFDVARDRLIGETKPFIVNEFRRSVYRSLLRTNILERLEPDSRAVIEEVLLTHYPPPVPKRPVVDQELLERVQALLPTTVWPAGLHHSIAEQLKVSANIVSRAISTLIDEGKVTKPQATDHE